MKKSVIVFSGLGADERVFCNIHLTGFDVTFVQWERPLKQEGIEHYASRLLDQIKTAKPTLIGLSFGGIIALEVAKLIEVENIVLISSLQSPSELPVLYRWSGYLKLHKILPSWVLKRANFISYWFFGAHTKQDKQLLKSILNDTDSYFLKWAIEKVLIWKSEFSFSNTYRIHGSNDRILPLQNRE
ncbi:MAG TPA: alpha/beta hydrolase, partial [Bacteroidia bacterium]